MSTLQIVIGSLLIVLSAVVVIVVLSQEARQANLGTIQGSSDAYLDKGKSRSSSAKKARLTKILAFSYFILVLVGMLLSNVEF